MLTVDFRRFPVRPGDRVLDLGCGGGRHAFEVYRRGADVVAFDLDPAELAPVTGMFDAMRTAGETTAEAPAPAEQKTEAKQEPEPAAETDGASAPPAAPVKGLGIARGARPPGKR